jgi:hypothetical protein
MKHGQQGQLYGFIVHSTKPAVEIHLEPSGITNMLRFKGVQLVKP